MSATDESLLLRSVLEDPVDDTLRLAYADALDESGQADRAAFVRTHIEATIMRREVDAGIFRPGPPRDTSAQFDRLCHLSQLLRGWAVHGDLFAQTTGVQAPPGHALSVALFDASGSRPCLNFSFSTGRVKSTGDMRLYFDRGLPSEWWCALLDFRDHAEFMFAWHPIVSVRFTDHEPQAFTTDAGVGEEIWRTLPAEWSDFHSHGDLPGWLPRVLCPIGGFKRKELATAAVSEKAVAYGRALHRLTPLQTPFLELAC